MDICTLEQSRGRLLLRSKRICMQLHTFSAKQHIKQLNRCLQQHKYSAHNDTSEIDCLNRISHRGLLNSSEYKQHWFINYGHSLQLTIHTYLPYGPRPSMLASCCANYKLHSFLINKTTTKLNIPHLYFCKPWSPDS